MHHRSNQAVRKSARLNYQFSDAQVRDYGFSVFRPVRDADLDGVFGVVFNELGSLLVKHRRAAYEKPMGLSMLEQLEAKRQDALGSLATRQAIDVIYEGVRSLRKPHIATPVDVRLLGHNTSNALSLSITFDQRTNDFINEERLQVQQALESLEEFPIGFSWNQYYTPHLSMGHVLKKRRSELEDLDYEAIIESMPETVRLERGQFYDPCAHWEANGTL